MGWYQRRVHGDTIRRQQDSALSSHIRSEDGLSRADRPSQAFPAHAGIQDRARYRQTLASYANNLDPLTASRTLGSCDSPTIRAVFDISSEEDYASGTAGD